MGRNKGKAYWKGSKGKREYVDSEGAWVRKEMRGRNLMVWTMVAEESQDSNRHHRGRVDGMRHRQKD